MAGFHGYFLWHELMTTDPAGAKKFYTASLGWTVTPGNIPGLDYDMWTTARGPVGGVMELPAEARDMGAPTHWIPYVGSSDIRASVERATSLGAQTYVPVTDIPEVGWFAVLSDPQGATFAIYQPGSPADADARPLAGDFSWHELATTDPVAALAFYGAIGGWAETEAHDMGPMGTYHLFGRDGHMFGGMFRKPAEMPGPPAWLCYVRVDDINSAVAAIAAAGGRIINGPMEVPGGDQIAQCMDPQGGMFAVHALKSA
jgi:predicted enzyme related to lactoylglutathione lyase